MSAVLFLFHLQVSYFFYLVKLSFHLVFHICIHVCVCNMRVGGGGGGER